MREADRIGAFDLQQRWLACAGLQLLPCSLLVRCLSATRFYLHWHIGTCGGESENAASAELAVLAATIGNDRWISNFRACHRILRLSIRFKVKYVVLPFALLGERSHSVHFASELRSVCSSNSHHRSSKKRLLLQRISQQENECFPNKKKHPFQEQQMSSNDVIRCYLYGGVV